MKSLSKIRLDSRVLELYPALTRAAIADLIRRGQVQINGQIITKPGHFVDSAALILVDLSSLKYVGRGGLKLEHALQQFRIEVSGLTALDAGLSTGGFSDCLLQRGIAKIYGVDVGHSQVHPKLTNDQRLIVMERINLKELVLPELVDLVVLDLSFISLLKVIDRVSQLIKKGGTLITLIKPQFEAGREALNAKGIVDLATAQRVAASVASKIAEVGFEFQEICKSPILGGDGNQEFLGWFVRK